LLFAVCVCATLVFVGFLGRHQGKRRDLKRLLELASRLGGDAVGGVKAAWARHAKAVGSSLACDEARDKDLVREWPMS